MATEQPVKQIPLKMQICLINPASEAGEGYHTMGLHIPPLGLQVIAKLTETYFGYDTNKYKIDLIDENFGTEKTTRILISNKYDIVCLTGMTCSAPRAYNIAKFATQVGAVTIFGGIHATVCAEEAQKYFDVVVRGEAEKTWPQILQDFEKNELKPLYDMSNPNRQGVMNWNANHNLQPLNGAYKIAAIQSTRGCPNLCNFCSVGLMNGTKLRRRGASDFIDEWNSIPEKFLMVVDDNFFGVTPNQAQEGKMILDAMMKKAKKKIWFSQTSINMGEDTEALKMAYEAGCRLMLIGLEAFDEKTLANLNKPTAQKALKDYKKLISAFHNAGIAVLGAVLFGTDADEPESISKTCQFACDIGVDIFQITTLTPLPGTVLFKDLQDKGHIIANNYPSDWAKYTFTHAVHNTEKMSATEMNVARYRFYRGMAQNNWVPKCTMKTLWTTKSLSTAMVVHSTNRGLERIVKQQIKKDERDNVLYAKMTAMPFFLGRKAWLKLLNRAFNLRIR